MSSRPWYKRYPSDFVSGTFMLTAEEKGVYAVLLDLMYDRGSPIPDDAQELGRVCGCSTRRFKQVRDKLASVGKITLKDGLISNNRFEKQVKKEENEHEKLSENAAKSHLKRAENLSAFNKNNDLEEKGQEHNQKPDTRSQKERDSSLPLGDTLESDFGEWYGLYPHKVGRGAALKAYRTARKKIGRAELIEAVRRYAAGVARAGTEKRFIPHPATWLNGERWADEAMPVGAAAPGAKPQAGLPLPGGNGEYRPRDPADFDAEDWRARIRQQRNGGLWSDLWRKAPPPDMPIDEAVAAKLSEFGRRAA